MERCFKRPLDQVMCDKHWAAVQLADLALLALASAGGDLGRKEELARIVASMNGLNRQQIRVLQRRVKEARSRLKQAS